MNRPNILFITCHDLGRHLGCYGKKTVTSPHLDQFAEKGVLFRQSFATGPTCSPSRAALHTGKYAHSNGVMGLTGEQFGWRLHPDEKHLAKRLQEAGYDTAMVGMQHVSPDGQELGYRHITGIGSAAEMADKAIDYLSQRTNLEEPFYLEVGFFEPHRPYDYRGTQPDSSKGTDIPAYLPDTEQAAQDIAALQGAIRSMDNAVGTLMEALERLGLMDNLWIVFTTDHGLALPRAKSTLYDPGIETALLMHWADAGIAGGESCDQLVSNVDIVPTILEGLGLDVPLELQGISFWPLLAKGTYEPRNCIFAEKNFHTQYEPMRCIRTDRYKLIANMEIGPRFNVSSDVMNSRIYPQMIDQCTHARNKIELYDLQSDPLEKINVAGNEAYAVVEAELLKQLSSWMVDTDDPILRGPIPSPYYSDVINMIRGE